MLQTWAVFCCTCSVDIVWTMVTVLSWLGLRWCHSSTCPRSNVPGISLGTKAPEDRMTFLLNFFPATMYSSTTLHLQMKSGPPQKFQFVFCAIGPVIHKWFLCWRASGVILDRSTIANANISCLTNRLREEAATIGRTFLGWMGPPVALGYRSLSSKPICTALYTSSILSGVFRDYHG